MDIYRFEKSETISVSQYDILAMSSVFRFFSFQNRVIGSNQPTLMEGFCTIFSLDPTFIWIQFFFLLDFIPSSFDPNMVWTTIFRLNIFLSRNLFWSKNYFCPKFFYPKFDTIFLMQHFFVRQNVLGQTYSLSLVQALFDWKM